MRAENVAEQAQAQEFARSLRDWGQVFMLVVWLQSIMAAAIARKSSAGNGHEEYLKARNQFMQKELTAIWTDFKREFPGAITEQEELTADMIILIRNQLAHCFVSGGTGLALFLPNPQSQKRLKRLNGAGWIEVPDAVAPERMLVLRVGDREWFDTNKSMILGFADKTVLRLTRTHGIEDGAIC